LTTREALALAEKIASSNYSKDELNAFIAHIRMAGSDEIDVILQAYDAAVNKQTGYQLKVGADFMKRLKKLKPQEKTPSTETLIIPVSKYRKWRLAVAAAILFVLLGSTAWLLSNHTAQRKASLQANLQEAHDVKAPASNNAVITLSNGKKIILDSAGKGSLALQGNVNLVKLSDGRLAYTGSTSNKNEVVYNTLTNPRGSKVISLTLSDGSKLWLNAASSIKYPIAFVGKARTVEMTGEAYFEISKDPSKPFTVSANCLTVEVLGTHFNINAYEDEGSLKTTLVEGSVRLKMNGKAAMLLPGQQAWTDPVHGIKINEKADVEAALAWKNGYFQFDNADIQMMMRQVARWYDIEVKYSGSIAPDKFSGKISRNVNLSQLLKILEYSDVHFAIYGKTVQIGPDSSKAKE
jgi:ferric-dicitrate binding protein FerR (iron transport regulator)